VDELLVRTSASSTLYYHHDSIGNVTHVTNASGNIAEKYSYDAFGAVTIMNGSGGILSASAVGNRFLFTGREFIQEVGLYDYRSRMYSQDLGRFLQTDLVAYARGMNLYEYVRNSPVNLVDPLGLTEKYFDVHFGAGDWKTGGSWLISFLASTAATPIELIPGTGTYHTVSAYSLEEAWQKMSANLKEGDCISGITFWGHGRPGQWDATGTGDVLQTHEITQRGKACILAAIKKRWCKQKNWGVTLKICNQAEGDTGQRFLKLLATAIGAHVTAWTSEYNLVLDFPFPGDLYTASPGDKIHKHELMLLR
jgi:RHS repeat-associated protein